ncbi:UNVERIFIED_CONTAM: hypothetical protein Sindi_0858300 [Sesamum indicum]
MATIVPARVVTPSNVDVPEEEGHKKDVQYQVMEAPLEEHQGVPFIEGVMADELLVNYHTPATAEYDGTTDPQEHLCVFRIRPLAPIYRWDQIVWPKTPTQVAARTPP